MSNHADTKNPDELRDQLARWTAAGLIDAGQAHRIEAAERARAAESAESAESVAHRRLPLVIEALGYLGAVVALAAGIVVVGQFWKNVPTAAELAFSGVAAVALTAAGAALRTGGEPAFARLRSVLWLLATASAAWFAEVLSHKIANLSEGNVALLTAATWLACAVALWWRDRTTLLHLSVFGGAVALTLSCMSQAVPGASIWVFGLSLWVLSVLWGVAAWRGYLLPRMVALAVSGAGLLVGAMLTMEVAAGNALAMATVVGLLAIGVTTRQVLALGLGAAGTIWVVPSVAGRYLPGSVAAPLAVAIVGLLLLGIALWLARSRRHA